MQSCSSHYMCIVQWSFHLSPRVVYNAYLGFHSTLTLRCIVEMVDSNEGSVIVWIIPLYTICACKFP